MADGDVVLDRAKFHAMTEGTQEDWMAIGRAAAPHRGELADRLLAHLRLLDNDHGGFAVDRLEHSLQTATRAHRDGRDEEYVVCALMHDIGDILMPANHAELGATILKPYVSDANHWMMDKHGVFQGYYFFHYLGLDRDMREQFRGHPHFEYCAQFCHLYDQNSFDPAYDSMPLEAFEPMLRRVVEVPKMSIYQKD
ncbi:MAG TPA: HD domain-containing protein [Phenylobacterium sp.]|jgi:predicted HD phosphohydrolase|uniref:HD domain-containing protein n=1 Tax=Phenylobacterium sp. TaxID=1871053 RepID=UPI002D59EEF6|nr:HD domain-containing protein [Phenylobacterium sp.]HZZ66877.1 HD domain-containing protein [Phenylobacterium sp.]